MEIYKEFKKSEGFYMNMIETLESHGYNMQNCNSKENDKVLKDMGLVMVDDKKVKSKIITYFKKMISYIYNNNLGDTMFGWAALIIVNNVIRRDGDWKKFKFNPSEIHTHYDYELITANNNDSIAIKNTTDYYADSKIYRY